MAKQECYLLDLLGERLNDADRPAMGREGKNTALHRPLRIYRRTPAFEFSKQSVDRITTKSKSLGPKPARIPPDVLPRAAWRPPRRSRPQAALPGNALTERR